MIVISSPSVFISFASRNGGQLLSGGLYELSEEALVPELLVLALCLSWSWSPVTEAPLEKQGGATLEIAYISTAGIC